MAGLELVAEGSLRGGLEEMTDGRSDARAGRVQAERAVVECIEDAVQNLDHVRRSLALQYSVLGNGTVAEFEVGELLQAVRRAVVRGRKALGEVAQQELPLPIV